MQKRAGRGASESNDLGEPQKGTAGQSVLSESGPLCEHPTGYQLPRLDRSFFGLLAILVGLCGFLYPWIPIEAFSVVVVVALTFLFGCSRTKRSTLVVLLLLYLPSLAISLVGQGSFDGLPQLPLLPCHWVIAYLLDTAWGIREGNGPWQLWLSALATILLFLSLVTILRFREQLGLTRRPRK